MWAKWRAWYRQHEDFVTQRILSPLQGLFIFFFLFIGAIGILYALVDTHRARIDGYRHGRRWQLALTSEGAPVELEYYSTYDDCEAKRRYEITRAFSAQRAIPPLVCHAAEPPWIKALEWLTRLPSSQ